MNLPNKIAWDDTVLPFQLDNADIRGRIARLDGVLEKVLGQHNYPPEVEGLVAEAALLTALIGQMTEIRWKLSLQIRGNGPVRIIATDYFSPTEPGAPAKLRAYASFDKDRIAQQNKTTAESPFSMISAGMFAILIDQGQGSTPYQGITPLDGGSLAACAETYFAQSEQLATRFLVAMGRAQEPGDDWRWRAGGVMIQHMPKASPHVKGSAAEKTAQPADEAEIWARVNRQLDMVDDIGLIGPHLAPTDLLGQVFHAEAPRVFPAQPVEFGCTCGPQKVVQTMSIYSAKDIAKMTDETGHVTADCQFCGAHYILDPDDLGFEAQKKVE